MLKLLKMPQPSLTVLLAEGMKRFKHKSLLGVIAQLAMVAEVLQNCDMLLLVYTCEGTGLSPS